MLHVAAARGLASMISVLVLLDANIDAKTLVSRLYIRSDDHVYHPASMPLWPLRTREALIAGVSSQQWSCVDMNAQLRPSRGAAGERRHSAAHLRSGGRPE